MTEPNKENRPIRRLLRRRNSQDYFSGTGWTTDPEHARSFEDALEAVQTCLHFGLADVEIVLRVAGASADLFSTELLITGHRPRLTEFTG